MLGVVNFKASRPEAVCPNCWGEQLYEGRFYQAVRDLQIDINNHLAVKTFIQKFVEDHLSGSYLQKEEHNHDLYCPHCHQRFRHHRKE